MSESADWRERIVLRMYRPLVLADFGMGVLDAMVETAAYVSRSLTEEEDRELTSHLLPTLQRIKTDKNDTFGTKQYQEARGLKRHQASGELRRLYEAGFIKQVEARFPRWSPQVQVIEQVNGSPSLSYSPLICLRLLSEDNKERALNEVLSDVTDSRYFCVAPEGFLEIPQSPFCYWIGSRIRRLFTELPAFEGEGRAVRVGLQTSDDFRFLRAWWEAPPVKILDSLHGPNWWENLTAFQEWCGRRTLEGKRWVPFAKGGEYSPYFADLHLVVNWENNGAEMKEFARLLKDRLSSPPGNGPLREFEYYFRPGLTWAYRTHRLCLQELPSGTIISTRGSGVFADTRTLSIWLAMGNSNAVDTLVKVGMGRAGHPQFDQGDLQSIPYPTIDKADGERLSEIGLRGLRLKKSLAASSEASLCWTLPRVLFQKRGELRESIASCEAYHGDLDAELGTIMVQANDLAVRVYCDENENSQLSSDGTVDLRVAKGEPSDDVATNPSSDEAYSLVVSLVSYTIGCAFGRFDIRLATGERPVPPLPDPFAALPVCAPGALTGEDGLPLSEAPEGYPLRLDSDGILVDDPTHADDLLTPVREVFELVWPKTAEAREREECALLDVKELRDYLRKPTAGGFWIDHVKRYSKSRRKAPIYWLLQSSKKSYALWLYYHRLDKDILYKALLNYVEPKMRLEESNLDQLRRQHEEVGTVGREAKQVEKQLEKQESLLSELHDFHDKLKRAADLRLEPDLNDGVVLNIAPLWELVPWTEAKKYWNELLDGKYEWSTVSKQLRAKGLIKT